MGQLLARTPFANQCDVPQAFGVTDADVFTDSGHSIKVILLVNHCGLPRDPLYQTLGRFSDYTSPLGAAIRKRGNDPCFRT